MAYINGKKTMQRMEKIAWVIDGILQAQVESQELVARVTTAMMRAPTLELSASNPALAVEIHLLIEVIQHADPP